MKKTNNILENIFLECQSNCATEEEIREAIQDLGLLMERHTQKRYGESNYEILFKNNLYEVRLTQQQADYIFFFLFYLLLNFPDRSAYVALALTKCYCYDMTEAACQGIELYMKKDDFTCVNLIKAIRNSRDLDKRTIDLFNIVRSEGLYHSKEYLNDLFKSRQLP